MQNYFVEKLMPELYQQRHTQMMSAAKAKGVDNLYSKERQIFARHCSGYVFPTNIELRAVTNSENGGQFVALFNLERSLISTDLGFILVTKDKKIAGISSSCIRILGLDIKKVKKLN